MKRTIFTLLLAIFMTNTAYGEIFTGGVSKVGEQESNRVIDADTKQGVDFAKVTIPQKKYHTYTDANGNFNLPAIKIDSPTILNVEKEGYRPFSVTINSGQSLSSEPMKITIARSSPPWVSCRVFPFSCQGNFHPASSVTNGHLPKEGYRRLHLWPT